jgi:hypothetical protein
MDDSAPAGATAKTSVQARRLRRKRLRTGRPYTRD